MIRTQSCFADSADTTTAPPESPEIAPGLPESTSIGPGGSPDLPDSAAGSPGGLQETLASFVELCRYLY